MGLFNYEFFLIFLVLTGKVIGDSVELYDLPICQDLVSYLDAIEKAVNFMEGIEADTNIGFSLLIVRANWLHAVKTLNLTGDLEEKINRIGTKVDYQVLSDKFPSICKEVNPLAEIGDDKVCMGNNLPTHLKLVTGPWRDDLGITKLFNLTEVPELNEESIRKVELMFRSTAEYIEDFTSLELTVRLSATCFDDYEKLRRGDGSVKCQISKKCIFFLLHGSNYGYGLSHRLVIIILANSRGCYVFTPGEDKMLKHRFCSAMYSEALYLVNHNYTSLDLLMEEVCLCSSLGYIQFLSRIWFTKVLSYQSDYGCFESTQFPTFSRRAEDIDVMCAKNVTYANFLKSRNCDIHLTSLTTAALAAGARYIMQKCYGVATYATYVESKDLELLTNVSTQYLKGVVS